MAALHEMSNLYQCYIKDVVKKAITYKRTNQSPVVAPDDA